MFAQSHVERIQCGIGGCRAPEVPNPFLLPAYEILFWDELRQQKMLRKTNVPVYHYAP